LADEFDMALTKEYSKIFFNTSFTYKILVSGTLTGKKRKLLAEIAPIVFNFTTYEAEEAGIINKTNYYVYNFRMTDEESEEYRKFNRKIALQMGLGNTKTAQYWVGQRKEFLFKLDSSYNHTRKVMRWLWERDKSTRLVIFTQRTEQADRLCKHSYHGKNEKEDNLAKFQSGEISAISVVAKIKRGINLKNANTGLFESLDGSTTEWEQRNGRLKRLPTSNIANVIFMSGWCKHVDFEGNVTYKETIVRQWIERAVGNLTGIELKDLKI
jgi:superfamily II DNA or RNA helicase